MTVTKELNFSSPGKYTIQAYYNKAEDAERLLLDKLGFPEKNIKINDNIIEIIQEFKDQCHLSGILTALNDMHFTILSVQRTGGHIKYSI